MKTILKLTMFFAWLLAIPTVFSAEGVKGSALPRRDDITSGDYLLGFSPGDSTTYRYAPTNIIGKTRVTVNGNPTLGDLDFVDNAEIRWEFQNEQSPSIILPHINLVSSTALPWANFGTNGIVPVSLGPGKNLQPSPVSIDTTSGTVSTPGTFIAGGTNLLDLIASGPGGETNTASTLGNGYKFTYDKSGVDLRFNSFTNSLGLTINSNGNVYTFGIDFAAVQAADPDLDSLAAWSVNGFPTRTGVNTWAARTITGDSELSVLNGNGASGNPTLSLGSSMTRDTEWNTVAKIETATGADLITLSEINSQSAFESKVGWTLPTGGANPWEEDQDGGGFDLTNVGAFNADSGDFSEFRSNDLILTNALAVPSGGTGRTNYSAGAVPFGNGTNAMSEILVQSTVTDGNTNLVTQEGIYEHVQDAIESISSGEGISGFGSTTNNTDYVTLYSYSVASDRSVLAKADVIGGGPTNTYSFVAPITAVNRGGTLTILGTNGWTIDPPGTNLAAGWRANGTSLELVGIGYPSENVNWGATGIKFTVVTNGAVAGGGGGGGPQTDDFNRANGGLGANWTVQLGSNMAIVDNAVKTTTTDTDQFAVWNGAGTFADNQYSKIKVKANVHASIVTVRSSGSAGTTTCYWARKDGVHKFVNNVYSAVGSSGDITVNIDDVLELRVTGANPATLQRYVNGVAAGTAVTDSDIDSGGKPGLGQYTTGFEAISDDWEGGSL
jgi:hypothetical protein